MVTRSPEPKRSAPSALYGTSERTFEEPTMKRIDMPCALAGFEPPPCIARIRFTPSRDALRLTCVTLPGRPPDLARWLRPHRPDSVTIPQGLSPDELRAKFNKIPTEWSRWMSDLDVHHMDLHPEGTATAFVVASDAQIEHMVAGSALVDCPIHVRPVARRPDLTRRQEEILDAAVRLGYYDMPHRTDLRTLGRKMGISVGSVSTLLRRAEAAVIHAFTDGKATARWTARERALPILESGDGEPVNLTRSKDPMRLLDEILDGAGPLPPWPRPGWGRKDAPAAAGPSPAGSSPAEVPAGSQDASPPQQECVCGADQGPAFDRDRIRSWPPHRSAR